MRPVVCPPIRFSHVCDFCRVATRVGRSLAPARRWRQRRGWPKSRRWRRARDEPQFGSAVDRRCNFLFSPTFCYFVYAAFVPWASDVEYLSSSRVVCMWFTVRFHGSVSFFQQSAFIMNRLNQRPLRTSRLSMVCISDVAVVCIRVTVSGQ